MFGLLAILAQSVSAQTTLISPSGDGGFETGTDFTTNGWTTANSANNPWVVGTAVTTSPIANRSAYISSNAGAANTYVNTAIAVNYFHRDVTVPVGESIILLTFNWSCTGESVWDMIQLFTAPTSVTPAGSTTYPGNGMSVTDLVGATWINSYNQNAGVQTVTVALPPSLAGTTFRLIFGWKNDGSGGSAPAVLDNIGLTSQAPNPICGIYTIDNTLPTAGSNFNSFTAAINRLNFDGICGPVTFNVTAGQTFPENTPAITTTGTLANTITFQRSGAGANPVITPTGGGGTADAGLTLSGGDYFTFNGIDINASAVSTVEYGYLVRNLNATDGARFNLFENFTVTLNRTNTTSRGVMQTSSTTGGGVTPTGEPGTNSSNTYRNFNIRNCFGGVWMNAGSTSWPDDGTQITTTACGIYNSIGDPNVVGDIGTASATTTYGIQMTSQQGFTIANTQVSNVTNTTSQLDGINVLTFSGTSTINNTIINNIRGTGTSLTTMAGLRVTHSTTTGAVPPVLRIYNNTISNITRAYTGTASATRGPRGIYLVSASSTNLPVFEIWNNTVTLDGSANPNLSNAVFETTNPIAGATLTVRNNIFANYTAAQGATAKHYGFVHTASATQVGNTGTVVSNNDIYIAVDANVSGFTALSAATNRNGVAAWQTAVAQASGNLEVDPVLAGDLSSGAAGLDAPAGFSPVPAYITTDLLCAARQADIGAYNINACTGAVAGTITGSNSICDLAGGSLNLTGSSTGLGISFQWKYGTNPGGPYDTNLGTLTSQDISALAVGTYYLVVDVTCSNGPVTATTPEFTLVVNPNPTATAGALDAVLCVGQTLDLTGGTDFGTSFSWTGPNGFTSTDQNPSLANLTMAGAGNYTLVASAAGCPSAASVVAISVNPNPSFTAVTATPNPICANGNSQLNANAIIPGGVTAYDFNSTSGTFNTIFGQPGTVVINTGADDTSYGPFALGFTFNYNGTDFTTAGVNANGFVGMGAMPTSSYNSLSTGTSNNVIAPFNEDLYGLAANGGTMLYQVSGTPGSQVFTFEWRNWGFWSLGANELSFQVKLYEGTNVIQFVYQNGTGTAGDPVQVGLRGASNAEVFNRTTTTDWSNTTAGANNADLCTFNGSVRPANGLTFTWSPPSVASYAWSPVTFLNDPNIANPLASTVTGTTTYTVTATSAAGCSVSTDTTVVVAPAISGATIAPVAPEYCAGGSVLLTATPVDGGAPYTYAWTDPNNNPAGTGATQAANLPGLWTVVINDACGGSPATASVAVVENPTPTVSASASQACMNGTLLLTGTNDIGTTFNWTGPNSFSSTSQNPSVSPVVAASAGTYTFTATLDGCTSAPATVIVSVDPAPTIASVTATPNPVCTGTDAQLNVTTFSGYSGSTIPFAPVSGTPIPAPTQSDDGVSTNIPIGFTFPFYGVNYTTLNISCNGLLSFTSTASGCCSGQSLPNTGTPNAVIALAWDDLNVGNGGSITYFNLTGPDRFVVNFNAVPFYPSGPGTVTAQAILFADGTIEIHSTAIDATGQLATQGIEDQAGTSAITVPGRNSTAWTAASDAYRFAPTTNTYVWTPNTFLNDATLANPLAVNPTATTPYSVLVTGSNGCSSTGNVTLTVNQSPDVALALVDNCIASQFSISVNVASTGNGPTVDLSYTVNGGAPIVVSGLGVGPQTPLGPFAQLDEVVVTIVDPVGGCNSTLPVFRSDCPEVVNCPNTLVKTYCYGNNDTRSWVFTSSNGIDPVRIDFVSGMMAPGDVIRAFDGTDNTGAALLGLTGNFPDLTGAFDVSFGPNLYLEVESDVSGSCADADPAASSWIFNVRCNPPCIDPNGAITPTADCFEQTFMVDVDVFDLGGGIDPTTSVDIEYTVNGGQPDTLFAVGLGITPIGPFNLGAVVNVRLLHDYDQACNKNLGSVTLGNSACPNDEPCSANILTMNPNYTCGTTTAGNMTGATLTAGITGGCTGVTMDQWYRFTATAPTHRVQLGGTTTGLSHSLYTGACGSLTLVSGTACVAGATASNPGGLTIGQIYYVRVSRTSAGTNAYTVCVSAPPLIDVDATVLAEPLATGCYSAAEDVIVTVLNNAIYPLDLSVDPLTVNVNVTGAATATLTGTLNTGVVAPGATVNVTMSTTLNMSVAGAYTFNGSAAVAGDGNAANNTMTAATRTVVAATALPISQNFTGFSGSNLAALAAPNNGWREGNGAAAPGGTTSSWTSSATTQQTQLGSGVSARLNFSTATRNEWIVSPKFIPVVGTQLGYAIAITEFGSGAVDAAGMEASDQVMVKVSTDCGVTWNPVLVHSEANTGAVSNTLVPQLVDLSAYAGQELIVAFHATKPSTGTHPSIDFHVDNIMIQNSVVCAGAPVAGTAAISNGGPSCAPASTGLSISGQSTDGGVVVTWLRSSTPGGPYTAVAGTGTSVALSGIMSTTYYVASVKCLITLDSTMTNEVSIQITPTPTASASAGPACTGQDLQLTGTTDIGTTYGWTGPNSFSSTAQNPLIPAITAAAGGTYTFTATANGCSTSGTVVVSVNNTPVVTSVTASPNPVCINGNSQLNATAPVPGYSVAPITFAPVTPGGGTSAGPAGDDVVGGPYNIGFPFTFYGVSYTQLRVSTNGFISFDAAPGAGCCSGQNLPNTGTPNNLIAFAWEDMNTGSGGTIDYFNLTSPNRFVMRWNNVSRFGSTGAIDGQVILYENGNIEVHTNSVTSTDNSNTTTQGVEGPGGTLATVVPGRNAVNWTTAAPDAYRFSPNQADFLWTPNTYLTADNIANPVAQNVAADITYTVTATASNGCVSAPAQITVEANPALLPGEAAILPASPSFCTGSNVTLTASPLGGGAPYTFAWTDPASNPAGTDATQVVNVPGTWSVTITDACGGTASASIVVNEYPVPVATVGSNSPVCAGDDILLSASSDVPGSTFAWTGPNGFTSTDEDPVITNATLAMIGSYSVVASANGCSSAPATTLVQVNVTPTTPTIAPTVWSLCPGGSVDLTASSTALTTLPVNTGGAITIPTSGNAAPYPSTINVSGLPASGVVVKQVLINGFSHTWPSDVDVALFSPTGQHSIIFADAIGTSAGAAVFNYVFQTGAPTLPTSGLPPSGTYGVVNGGSFNGTGTPSAPTSANLTNFTGDVNGNWSLYVYDDVGGDGGSITSWGIVFEFNNVTYTWTGAGLNTNSGATVTATPGATTTYTVTAENNGCSASEDVIVYIGTNELTLEVETDANASQTSWELIQQGTNEMIFSGGGLPSSAVVTQFACLPDGCYRLRVLDSGGDGIAGGGYILRTNAGARIIDNRDNFTTGSVSAVIANGGFCLPLGTDQLIYTSCDKLDWVNNQYIVAAPNAAVSAQWGIGDQTDDGYMFWFFDPNGSYGYAKFRNHATSDGFGPASATRACHARINNWSPNQIPANVLMNVKVRSRVNGVNSAWGPVCRFRIDPVRAACPLTKLMDIPGNQFYSCGVTKTWGGNNRIHARPVDGATQYQFRFNNGELGAPVVRTTTNYYLNLNWTPALPNGTYEVQVRAFKNGAWCVTSLPWGDVCNVTITGSQAMALPGTGTTAAAELAMFPNPNNGDQLTLSLSAVEEGVQTVSVDIFDLNGARVVAKVIPVNDGRIFQQLAVNELASGVYMVHITAGDQRYTERLVIAK